MFTFYQKIKPTVLAQEAKNTGKLSKILYLPVVAILLNKAKIESTKLSSKLKQVGSGLGSSYLVSFVFQHAYVNLNTHCKGAI